MKLCNYALGDGGPRAGLVEGSRVFPLARLTSPLGPAATPDDPWLSPQSLPQWLELVRGVHLPTRGGIPLRDVVVLPPIRPARTFRDFYAFEQHVRRARARRGLEMIPQWYERPVFYYANPYTILGPDEQLPVPRHGKWLDFELEVGAVIGRAGRDIPAEAAEGFVAGYTVINDWSLRDVQRREMAVGLGPAKGKDFATSMGPYLVTPDELRDRRCGKGYDLQMTARVDGVEVSRGTWSSITFGFDEMIERASRGVTLQPGDIIGSGTVGTGCILELGPDEVGGWLRPGNVVELEIERLGVLRNAVVNPAEDG